MSVRLREGALRELHVRGNERARHLFNHRTCDRAQGGTRGKSSSVRRSEEPRDGVSRASQCIQARGEHRYGLQGPCSVGPWFGHHERIRMGSPHHARDELLRCCPDSIQHGVHRSGRRREGVLRVLHVRGSELAQHLFDRQTCGRAQGEKHGRLSSVSRSEELHGGVSRVSQCIQARGEHKCGLQGPCSAGPWFGHREKTRMVSLHRSRGGL